MHADGYQGLNDRIKFYIKPEHKDASSSANDDDKPILKLFHQRSQLENALTVATLASDTHVQPFILNYDGQSDEALDVLQGCNRPRSSTNDTGDGGNEYHCNRQEVRPDQKNKVIGQMWNRALNLKMKPRNRRSCCLTYRQRSMRNRRPPSSYSRPSACVFRDLANSSQQSRRQSLKATFIMLYLLCLDCLSLVHLWVTHTPLRSYRSTMSQFAKPADVIPTTMEMEVEKGKLLAGAKRRYYPSEDESEDDHPSGYKRAKTSSNRQAHPLGIRPGEHMLPCSRFRSFDNARRNDRATAMDESLDLSPTVSEEVDTEEVDMEEGDVGEEEPTTAMDESLDLSPTVSEELEMADEPLEQESFCPANTFEGLGASISISTNIHILSIHYAGIGQNVAMAQYLVYLHTRPIIHDKHAQAWDRHPSGPHCGFPVIKSIYHSPSSPTAAYFKSHRLVNSYTKFIAPSEDSELAPQPDPYHPSATKQAAIRMGSLQPKHRLYHVSSISSQEQTRQRIVNIIFNEPPWFVVDWKLASRS
ncbi:MAG: hypothetical protein LQ350_005859 [Teloschistes chrysophthalmus]|nr:MAG: hypothetical protein LQ350_005859 [Niorma chrysophthalma]